MKKIILFFFLFFPLSYGEEIEFEVHGKENGRILSSFELQNLFLYRNDSDFDRTAPYYKPSGQSVGIFGTIFTPRIKFNIIKNLSLYYEVELGLNYWSKNNPDQINPIAEDVFLVKHRELWSEGSFFDEKFGFKVGYQRLIDPTGLFINHWIGAGNIIINWEQIKFTISAGQIPDQTYEGFYITENNFKHDTFVFGSRADISLSRNFLISSGVYSLYDASIIGKTNFLLYPCINLKIDFKKVSINLDGGVQFGYFEESTLKGEAQNHLAWTFQINTNFALSPLQLEISLLFLSPDDQYDMNKNNYAFHYSGKSKSPTLLLTEDELRDKYDNIDEKMAAKRGAFFLTRTGFFLSDTKISYIFGKYFRPYIIFGSAFSLEEKNSLGKNLIGIEIDSGIELNYKDRLIFNLVGGILIAGGAGSSHINKIDLIATDNLYMIESSLTVKY